MYALMGLGTLFNLVANFNDLGKVASLLPLVLLFAALVFVHFKAYAAVGSMDKILLRSSSWSSLPNILSTVFIVLFLVVLLFVAANAVALGVFLIGLIIYVFLIIGSLGSILGKDWFTFHYFTHYATGFWHLEHTGLSYFVPDGHDQTVAVCFMVALILFIIPTCVSLFVLGFKHLVMEDGAFSLFGEAEAER